MTKAARREFERRMMVYANDEAAGDTAATRRLITVCELYVLADFVGSKIGGNVMEVGGKAFNLRVNRLVNDRRRLAKTARQTNGK